MEQRAEEWYQGGPVVTPQGSATNNVLERREHKIARPGSTTTPTTVLSKHAKATLNERVGKDAVTVQ
ncbi:MAG: hypothetical protein ACXWC1_32145, partial [Burkholderiales bacterium]